MKAHRLDARTLREWPLPAVAEDADKESRGRVLVVGGSGEIGGAAQLAGVAALRAGAGKLVIATAQSCAVSLAQFVPEARVIALHENTGGSFTASGADAMASTLSGVAAVLVGPGMVDADGNIPFVARILAGCREVPVVLDACAMDSVAQLRRFEQPVVMTPHAGEMAHLLSIAKDDVTRDPQAIATRAASQWNAIVALKGSTTWIATPRGQAWCHDGGHPGLATSGSGDVLAGLVAGFLARGAAPEQAAAWGVVIHGMAGSLLAREVGPVGFLARELPGVVPRLMKRVARQVSRQPAKS